MVIEILDACVLGPFQVQYLHPATLKWTSTEWEGSHEAMHDAVGRAKDIHQDTRVLDPGGRVMWRKRS